MLSAIGAGVSAAGTLSSAYSSANAANYQAAVASNNAITQRNNAKYSEEAGRVQATSQGLKAAQAGARVKGAQAANGIDVNTGSAVDVQEAVREQGALDTDTVMHNANMKAYGYRVQADNSDAEAVLDRGKADSAITGGYLGAAGSLLSSASSIGGKWGGGGGGSGSSISGVANYNSGNPIY